MTEKVRVMLSCTLTLVPSITTESSSPSSAVNGLARACAISGPQLATSVSSVQFSATTCVRRADPGV